MPRPGRQPGPWYGDFVKRRRFERGVADRFPAIKGSMSRTVSRRGWVYRLELLVEGYPARWIQIFFPPPSGRIAVVLSDGPASPHRYADGSLCMWHPKDPPEQRWAFEDGLLALLAQIQVHLFKEAWWRETAGSGGEPEWLGDEAPHGPLPDQKTRDPRETA